MVKGYRRETRANRGPDFGTETEAYLYHPEYAYVIWGPSDHNRGGSLFR